MSETIGISPEGIEDPDALGKLQIIVMLMEAKKENKGLSLRQLFAAPWPPLKIAEYLGQLQKSDAVIFDSPTGNFTLSGDSRFYFHFSKK
ncbi:MAG: hypothetical protein A3F47_01385 [Candidatus Staskawiczbacteria bacterium RIFCSPHIGHO2_12_FULL_38_11]|uniref:Uncharacterized protein n=1 Tax=Candidatus Staskawiczbacteria bacterium RIFCSPHIGHO2_12_FULL_38_11 TaxID=1802209 RepID=A0A1G2I7N0_9BACT|nr:MAG: hypothetical protein A3F47_01385 [Candidatus Staskawiczbacteria bacterium RIFCSPHIGHO2_12_FULL_38_11]